jgi:hypothetical protein
LFQQKVIFGGMKTACMLSASSPVLTGWMAWCDVQNKQGPLVQILSLAVLLFKGREEWCTPLVPLTSVKIYVQEGIFFQYTNVINVKNLLGRIFTSLTDYLEFI